MIDTIHHRLQTYCARAFPERNNVRVTNLVPSRPVGRATSTPLTWNARRIAASCVRG